ncbi:unnamed protein product [Dracunculus medinensis]|uniref:C-type lectin domain-containing protein n=1 Tax=Dracunculus medinensis TaxID=318479 RepID=A0A0N4UMI0_DRAME|nr:unnamed protein product [Dracunculus medinensis]
MPMTTYVIHFMDCPGGYCLSHHVCVERKCELDPLAPLDIFLNRYIPSTSSPITCSAEWTKNDKLNACYIVRYGSYDYQRGNEHCISLGGHLASVHSSEEMYFINSIAGGTTYWIGFHNDGSQRWDDSTVVNYTNYRRTQPDQCCPRAAAFCTLVNFIGHNGQWDDAGCDRLWVHQINIVCKKFLA